MSEAVSTTGILVKRSPLPVADPAVYTTVAEITMVTPPGKSRNKLETSTHNDGAESYVLGILRQKDAAFTVNWLPDDETHAQIEDDIDTNTKASWRVEFPSGIKMTGNARVQNFEPADAPVDGIQAASVTLAWSGLVVTTLD